MRSLQTFLFNLNVEVHSMNHCYINVDLRLDLQMLYFIVDETRSESDENDEDEKLSRVERGDLRS